MMWKLKSSMLIFLMGLLVLGAGLAHAGPAAILFSNISTTGARDLVGAESATHTVDCVFTNTTGTVTALVVTLEGSIDSDNFDTLATHTFSAGDISAKKAMFHVTDKYAAGVRGNLTTVTTSGDMSLTCKHKSGR